MSEGEPEDEIRGIPRVPPPHPEGGDNMRTIDVTQAAEWSDEELQDNVLYLKDRLYFRDLDEVAKTLKKARKVKKAEWVEMAAASSGPIELLGDQKEEETA